MNSKLPQKNQEKKSKHLAKHVEAEIFAAMDNENDDDFEHLFHLL